MGNQNSERLFALDTLNSLHIHRWKSRPYAHLNNQFLLAASTTDGHKNVGFVQLGSSHLIHLGPRAESLILGPDNAFLVSKANDLAFCGLVIERDFIDRIVGRVGNGIESPSA